MLAGFRAGTRTRLGLAGRGRATLDAELATTTARNRMRPAVSVAQAISLVAVMAVGTAMVDGGSLEIGTLSAAALYLIQLFSPVGNLLEQSDELQRSTASFARLVGVTQLPFDHHERLPEPEATTAVAVAGPPSGDAGTLGVTVRDPRVRVRARDAVLDGITLDVAPGEHLAVVGPSGAGKTTLGKIIAGLLHAQHGEATIGGCAVDRMEPHDRSQLVAMVAQEVHVFTHTVAENVRLGRPDATDDDVRAGAHGGGRGRVGRGTPRGDPHARGRRAPACVDHPRGNSSRSRDSCASTPPWSCWTKRPPSWIRSRPPAPSATSTPRWGAVP